MALVFKLRSTVINKKPEIREKLFTSYLRQYLKEIRTSKQIQF